MRPIYPMWILVSDSSRARLFSVASAHRPLVLEADFEHAESRAREQELVTDRPGRMSQSTAGGAQPGHGSRSGMEPSTPPKTVAHERFARILTMELNTQFSRNAYARLVITANPEFLGLLRDNLSEPLKKNLVATLNKDYTRLTEVELAEQLAPLLMSVDRIEQPESWPAISPLP